MADVATFDATVTPTLSSATEFPYQATDGTSNFKTDISTECEADNATKLQANKASDESTDIAS